MPQEVIKKNHMDVAWHEYTDENGGNVPVVDSSIAEKASIIGRVGIMFLSCGTRSMESEKFHEYTGRSTWHYVYGGYWSDVH